MQPRQLRHLQGSMQQWSLLKGSEAIVLSRAATSTSHVHVLHCDHRTAIEWYFRKHRACEARMWLHASLPVAMKWTFATAYEERRWNRLLKRRLRQEAWRTRLSALSLE